jgi:hypothetical protein
MTKRTKTRYGTYGTKAYYKAIGRKSGRVRSKGKGKKRR